MKKRLCWCDNCNENSVTRKLYTKKDGTKNRVEFCINKGCKYRLMLPIINTLLIIIVMLSTPALAYQIPEEQHTAIANILYAESANDAEGWTAKLNTYYKGKRNGETLINAMRRVCSAHRTRSKQFIKAETQDLNAYELRVYKRLIQTIKDFKPDTTWQYIHHENLNAFYDSRESALAHLQEAWGGGVDYINYKTIGKEAYFKRK